MTKFEYNGLGGTTKLTAVNVRSSGAQDQETEYSYEDNYNASLVTETTYPDSGTVALAYHLDGSLASRTDQRGVVMTYGYDYAMRVDAEYVSSFGSSAADPAVQAITRLYDPLGRVEFITSHSSAQTRGDDGMGAVNSTDAVNQIKYSYDTISGAGSNDIGRVRKTEQDHSGAVGGGEPSVEYAYDESDNSDVYDDALRLQKVTYPSTRIIHTTYGSSNSLNDRLSRVNMIEADSSGSPGTDLISYGYNGTSRLVQTTYPGPKVWSSDDWNNDSVYTRLDRFGRRISMWWHGSTGNGGRYDDTVYTYDFAGNRTSRDIWIRNASGLQNLDGVNIANDLWDQDFEYDGLQRLVNVDQGKADLTSHVVTASNNFRQQWSLDQLGNWEEFDQDNNGNGSAWDLEQSRTHNEVNETTAIGVQGGGAGSAWATPAYDNAGNMTTMPQPKAPTATGFAAIYDAWNRLVELKISNATKAAYEYDGLHRRVVRDESGSSGMVRHFYYNENWQCLEERATEGGNPIKQYVWHPHYIDALAISYTDLNADGNLGGGGEGTHYYCHDANFNVTAVLNGSGFNGVGTTIERYAYSPYGEATVLNADFTLDSTGGDGKSDIGNEFLYTGRRLDPETGLQYSRYRYYHPQMGRFVTQDPIGYRGGTNLYAYVGGMPTVGLDPSGLEAVPIGAPIDPMPPRIYPPSIGGGVAGGGSASGGGIGSVIGGVGKVAIKGFPIWDVFFGNCQTAGGPCISDMYPYGYTPPPLYGPFTAQHPHPNPTAPVLGPFNDQYPDPNQQTGHEPGSDYEYQELSEEEKTKRREGRDCTKAKRFHLLYIPIPGPDFKDEHQFKTEYGACPNSKYDICACKDGSIVIRAVGQCGTKGPTIETDENWLFPD